MSVRAAVLSFVVHAGTSTQTVTGVQDAEGSFIGKIFLFQSAFAVINTVTAGGTPFNYYVDDRGIDTGTVRSSEAVADLYSGFNFKAVAGGLSLGDHSLIDVTTGSFGTASFERKAKISAIRSGEFDIAYDLNGRDGDSVLVLVFGGDDLDIALTNYVNGTYTTPSKPQGLLSAPVPLTASSGSTSVGTGGQNIDWGFATRDGDYGTLDLHVVNQGNNWSAQRTDGWTSAIDATTGVQGTRPTVSAWGDTSFTIANGGVAGTPIVFCGENVRCVGLAITQPLTASSQQIDFGIAPKAILFFSTGYAVSSSTQAPVGQFSMGWATGAASPTQVGFWNGETTNGNTGAVFGARYLSNSTVLRFGTPNAASTTFTNVANVTNISATDGTADLNWSLVDGTARQVLVFAIGEDIPAPPTPSFHTTTFVRRRLRRSPILWSENQGLQTQVRVNLIAVDMQPGVSTQVDTPDAQVMIRASKDGGRTWTSERFVSVGAIGAYTQRLNTWRWGQGRQWVVEVSTSDPVVYNLVNLYIDAEPGTS